LNSRRWLSDPRNHIKRNRSPSRQQHYIIRRYRKFVQSGPFISRNSLHSSHQISLENIEAINVQPNTSHTSEESSWRDATLGGRDERAVNRHSLRRVFNTAGGTESFVCAQGVVQGAVG